MDFRQLLREERRRAKEKATAAEAQAPASAKDQQPEEEQTEAADAWVPGLPLRCWAQRCVRRFDGG